MDHQHPLLLLLLLEHHHHHYHYPHDDKRRLTSGSIRPLLKLFLSEAGPRWADASFLIALSLCKSVRDTGKGE